MRSLPGSRYFFTFHHLFCFHSYLERLLPYWVADILQSFFLFLPFFGAGDKDWLTESRYFSTSHHLFCFHGYLEPLLPCWVADISLLPIIFSASPAICNRSFLAGWQIFLYFSSFLLSPQLSVTYDSSP